MNVMEKQRQSYPYIHKLTKQLFPIVVMCFTLNVEVLDNLNMLHKRNCLEKIFENVPLTHLYEYTEPYLWCPRPFLGALCQIFNQIVVTAKGNPHQWFQGPFLVAFYLLSKIVLQKNG